MRRIHVQSGLDKDLITLEQAQAHHLRDVLRMTVGAEVEAFDDAGQTALTQIERVDPGVVLLRVVERRSAPAVAGVVVASAVPKGERADWMVEKLSELGVSRFIPLMTARSVVHPTGKGKRERWQRLATEAARQSHRPGVMQIDELTELEAVIRLLGETLRDHRPVYLSTAPDAVSLPLLIGPKASLAFLIGPEGGWSEQETGRFAEAGLTGARLTTTILRVETAAVAAAAIALCHP